MQQLVEMIQLCKHWNTSNPVCMVLILFFSRMFYFVFIIYIIMYSMVCLASFHQLFSIIFCFYAVFKTHKYIHTYTSTLQGVITYCHRNTFSSDQWLNSDFTHSKKADWEYGDSGCTGLDEPYACPCAVCKTRTYIRQGGFTNACAMNVPQVCIQVECVTVYVCTSIQMCVYESKH